MDKDAAEQFKKALDLLLNTLTHIAEQQEALSRDINNLSKAVFYGNGEKPLLVRVSRLETEKSEKDALELEKRQRHSNLLAAFIGGVLALLGTLLTLKC